jgi:uncharacterized protein with FMN-binding domain
MRRAVLALVGTAVGTTLIIATKLGPRPAAEAGIEAGVAATVDLGLSPSVSPPGVSAAPSSPAVVTGSKPPPSPPAPPPPPPAGGLKNGTFAGPGVAAGRYGTIKVTIVISGGKITDVTATYPTGGQTGSINARAIPKLRQEALTAQSASIATVSGATYTSNAYKQSLQAAINAARS